VRADQRRQGGAVRLVEAVPVDQGAQPGTVGGRIAARGQRHEAVRRVREVPQAGTGAGAVPVDEDPPLPVPYQVPGCEVVVADQLGPVGRDDHVPPGVRRRAEVRDRVVEVADEATGAAQFRRGHRRQRVRHPAGDVLEDVPAPLVAAQGPGRAGVPDGGQVCQQRLDRRGGGAGRLAYRRADPDHAGGHVAAVERFLHRWYPFVQVFDG
jgi:hypothetical protein